MGNEQKTGSNINLNDFEKAKQAIFEEVGLVEDIEIKKHYTVSKDNTIHFEFKHNEAKYKDLTAVIENVLNILKLEDPDEIQALIFKLKKSDSLIINEEIKGYYEQFIQGLEGSYKQYIEKLSECLSTIKNNYLSNSSFLSDYFKGDRSTDMEIEESIYSENNDKEEFIQKVLKYHKFEEQIEFINKFCSAIDESLIQYITKKEELKKFCEEHESKVNLILDANQKDQILSFLMFLGSLVNFFNLRNGLIDKISDILLKKNDIYVITLQGNKKTTHLDFIDSLAELNEFLQVNIYQKFILHIESKHKFIFDN